MYASIRQGKVNPGAMEEILQRINDELVDIVSEVPGFIAYYIVDLGDDELMIVNILENEEAGEESARRALGWVRDNLAGLIAAPPSLVEGHVIVHAAK